jgi:hypothetical protein
MEMLPDLLRLTKEGTSPMEAEDDTEAISLRQTAWAGIAVLADNFAQRFPKVRGMPPST